jgi:hypothetical protein
MNAKLKKECGPIGRMRLILKTWLNAKSKIMAVGMFQVPGFCYSFRIIKLEIGNAKEDR